jgi:hypothetical protein
MKGSDDADATKRLPLAWPKDLAKAWVELAGRQCTAIGTQVRVVILPPVVVAGGG